MPVLQNQVLETCTGICVNSSVDMNFLLKMSAWATAAGQVTELEFELLKIYLYVRKTFLISFFFSFGVCVEILLIHNAFC